MVVKAVMYLFMQSTGTLKVNKSGLVWKKDGGGRVVEVPAEGRHDFELGCFDHLLFLRYFLKLYIFCVVEITGFQWINLPKTCMLLTKRKEASALSFIGLREVDLSAIKNLNLGPIEESPIAVSGHNWGSMEVDGASLVFKVGGKPSFVIPLPDVAQVNQGRDEVLVQFPIDDTGASDREDALVEVAFHIPKGCPDFAPLAPPTMAEGADGEAPPLIPSSKVFFDVVNGFVDSAAATGDAISTFDSIGVLVPRGRFDMELYASTLKLVGQAQDFRVQYDSIQRIFILPKSNTPQTLVAVCLDPPIRKGQTFYNTMLCQFHNDEEITVGVDLTDEQLAAKNAKGAKLDKEMRGAAYDVFARVVRGLSGAKLTRPGTFRDSQGEGHAVRCNYKSDDGYLYPLERAFFYVQKPPLLMPYDDVESVEFLRQATGITAAKTFDLAVRMKSGPDHVFRSIPRSEWANMFEYIQAKQLRIENFKEAQRGPGAAVSSYAEDLAGGVDAGLAAQAAFGSDSEGGGSSDEEDEDFAASEGSSSDEEEESDGEGGVKIVAEDEDGAPRKKAKTEKKPKKAAPAAGEDGGDKKVKKTRKKKDKDAPKKGLSAFMFFSNDKREQIKTENPGIAFGEVGKKLGELWKTLTPEDKAPYDAKAEEDKGRYALELEAYNKKKAGATEAAGSDSDGGDEPAAPMEAEGGDSD
jgi:structure-specific recognition protein 1